MTENKDVIKSKLEYFLSNNIKVHVTKFNKEFINGNVTSKFNDDIYIITDEFGNTFKLFIIEVFDVDEWKTKGVLK